MATQAKTVHEFFLSATQVISDHNPPSISTSGILTHYICPHRKYMRGYGDNMQKWWQHSSLTMTTSTKAASSPLTPTFQHKFYHDHSHCHITCDDTAAWFGWMCSFLGEISPFLPFWICYEMKVMRRNWGEGYLIMGS